jgi:hypothetical protein
MERDAVVREIENYILDRFREQDIRFDSAKTLWTLEDKEKYAFVNSLRGWKAATYKKAKNPGRCLPPNTEKIRKVVIHLANGADPVWNSSFDSWTPKQWANAVTLIWSACSITSSKKDTEEKEIPSQNLILQQLASINEKMNSITELNEKVEKLQREVSELKKGSAEDPIDLPSTPESVSQSDSEDRDRPRKRRRANSKTGESEKLEDVKKAWLLRLQLEMEDESTGIQSIIKLLQEPPHSMTENEAIDVGDRYLGIHKPDRAVVESVAVLNKLFEDETDENKKKALGQMRKRFFSTKKAKKVLERM